MLNPLREHYEVWAYNGDCEFDGTLDECEDYISSYNDDYNERKYYGHSIH